MKTMKTIKSLVIILMASMLIQSCSSEEGTDNECTIAKKEKTTAEAAYNTDTTDEVLCKAYKMALENEITTCGDSEGALQEIIDGLGNCTTASSNAGDLSVTAGTLNIVFTTNSTVLESGVITVNGSNLDQGANYKIYFELEENTIGQDIMQNFKLTLNGSDFYPNTSGFDDFTNNITVNSGGMIKGTFGGLVSKSNGGDLNLSRGILDLAY